VQREPRAPLGRSRKSRREVHLPSAPLGFAAAGVSLIADAAERQYLHN